MSETRLRSFYPSRLDTWTQCPRRYRFRYLDDPPPPRRGAFAHTTLGAATHVALARWWELPEVDRTPGRVAAAVDDSWTDDGFADASMSAAWRVRAREMVAAYVEAESRRRALLVPLGLVEPRRIESSVALLVDDSLALMGRPDRIDERPTPEGTELVVVDYKTSRRVPTQDEARTSRTLAVYAAAAEATLRRPAVRVELHHLPSGSIAVWRHDDVSRERQVRRSAQVARDCRAVEAELEDGGGSESLFPPRPSKLCPWCDYRESCPAGMEMGPPALPWAALEPSPVVDGSSGSEA